MFDKFFIGNDVVSSANNGKYKPVSRVTLLLDDNNAITAGDDTGREIVANCPHATQEMVNALLASLKGYEYQAYEAGAANIDPAAELGDGVTVGGIYSVIASLRDDGDGYASLSAPGEAELEDEYPMDGPMTQMFNREIKKVGSAITKTAEEIRLEVAEFVESVNGDVSNLQSSITQTAEDIRLEIANLTESVDGDISDLQSSITQTAEDIRLEISNLTESVDGSITDLQSSISQTATDIRLEITNLTESVDGSITDLQSSITQTAEDIRAEVSSLIDGEGGISQTIAALQLDLDGIDLKYQQKIEGYTDENGEFVDGVQQTISALELGLSGIDLKYQQTIEGYTDEEGNFVDGLRQTIAALELGADGFKVNVEGALGTDADGNLKKVSSSITAALGELSLSATSKNGTATLTLKNGNAELSSKEFTLNVDAVNISGILSADSVELDGMFKISRKDIFGSATGYIGTNTSKSSVMLASENLNTGFITNNTTAKMTYYDEHMIWVHSGGCYSNETIQIYSDRTLKDNIDYDLTVEEKIFAGLRPCSFSYISDKNGKKHWGFIAQDFIGSAEELGMDTDKLAVLGEYEGKYSIGYGEITALNTHMIQRLMRRVADMESRLEE